MTDQAAIVPVAEGRPTPAELEAAALVAARELHAHLIDGVAGGRIGALKRACAGHVT